MSIINMDDWKRKMAEKDLSINKGKDLTNEEVKELVLVHHDLSQQLVRNIETISEILNDLSPEVVSNAKNINTLISKINLTLENILESQRLTDEAVARNTKKVSLLLEHLGLD